MGIGSNSTEHNDSWLKFPDAYDFFGQEGNSIVYPKGGKFIRSSSTANGSSANGWMKVYQNGSASIFNWTTFTSDFNAHKIYAEFRSAGIYTIQVAARSNGHFIDRMVLYKESSYSEGSATSTSRTTTNCSGGDTSGDNGGDNGGDNEGDSGGNDGSPLSPTVSLTNPTDGQIFAEGTNISVTLAANDPDGSITRHEIYLNGSKVDTDGVNYSNYVINNATPGNYTVRAVVTDNGGNTAEDTVSFTVEANANDGGSDDGNTGDGNNGGDNTGDDNTGDDGADESPISPTVNITNPTDGQVFTEGTTISVTLSADDPDGELTKHEIYVNDLKVDTDGATYSAHKINNVAVGNYTVRAVVTDNGGNTAEDAVAFSVEADSTNDGNTDDDDTNDDDTNGDSGQQENQSPQVTIVSPANNFSIAEGEALAIELNVSDPDGAEDIDKVVVKIGDQEVTLTEAPFQTQIEDLAVGEYTLEATVYDNSGETQTKTVTVNIVEMEEAAIALPQIEYSIHTFNYLVDGEEISSELKVLSIEILDEEESHVIEITGPNDFSQEVTTEVGTPTIIENLELGTWTIRIPSVNKEITKTFENED